MADFSISVIFGAIDKITSPIRRISKSLSRIPNALKGIDKQSQKTERSITRTFKAIADRSGKLGKSLNKVGNWMSTRITLPLTAFGTLSMKASMDINEAMANVSTLMTGTSENVDRRVGQMKKGVQGLAIEFGKDTGDMAGGLYDIISAFGDTGNSMEMLRMNAKMATAGLSTTRQAIDLTSAVTKAYGDTSLEAAERVSDMAFTTVRLGKTTFPELAASIGRVAPLAAKLNISQEEMFAGFSALTGVTGNTAEVSTQLSAALTALLKPSEMMPEAIELVNEQLGTMYKNSIDMTKKEGVVNTFKMLATVLQDNEELFTAVLGGRKEALLAAFALTGTQHNKFIKDQGAMGKAAGETGKALKRQTEGINKTGFAWKQFTARFKVFRERVGDQLAPALEKVMDKLTPVLKGFGELSGKKQGTIIAILGITAALGPLVKILGGLGMAASKLPWLFAMATSPIGLTVLAIAGAVGVLTLAVKHFRDTLKPFDKKWKATKKEDVEKGIKDAQKEALEMQFRDEKEERDEWGKLRKVKVKRPILGRTFALGKKYDITEEQIKAMGGQVTSSETDINLKVTTDPGTNVAVEKVTKKKGKSKIRLSTDGYMGQVIGAIP
jgi:TP901 family phage tail tape measure protein